MSGIDVDGVWKRFRRGHGRHYASVGDFLKRREPETVGNDPGVVKAGWFWALQDVSFRVEPGQVLGLIGANGSGKSTMLKLLTRISRPTRGTMRMEGRVSSLLEVGTGFHQELTGRDNVYFSGAVLGMRRAEIERHFDEIVDFSGCGSFIDTPVKHYSSGMAVRLAFSVAAFLDTDIMLIDEVLAVGDAEFQRRCLGRMSEVSSSGRTIVFVSHNLSATNQLCDRALWFDRGVVRQSGLTADVIAGYLSTGAQHTGTYEPQERQDPRFQLIRADVVGQDGRTNALVDTAETIHVRMRYRIDEPIARLSVGFLLASMDGIVMLDARDSDDPSASATRTPGEYVFDCRVPGPLLPKGQYVLTFYAAVPQGRWLATHRSALLLDVEDLSRPLDEHGVRRLGVVRPELVRRTARVTDHPILP